MALLLKRRFTQECGQNHREIVQKVHFPWSCVAQKRGNWERRLVSSLTRFKLRGHVGPSEPRFWKKNPPFYTEKRLYSRRNWNQISPWFSYDQLDCFNKLLQGSTFMIHCQTKTKVFRFFGIRKLVCKQWNCYHRNPMICRLIKAVVSYMSHKSFDVLVTKKIILR